MLEAIIADGAEGSPAAFGFEDAGRTENDRS
jgi:hypothetical protein